MFIQLWSNGVTITIIIEHYPTEMGVFHNIKKWKKKNDV